MNYKLMLSILLTSIGIVLGMIALSSYLQFDGYLFKLGLWWNGY